MRPRLADRRERGTPGPATEPWLEPDGAAVGTAVMDGVWEIGGMHVHVLGRGERFWLGQTKAISVMSSLRVKQKSVSRYAQNGSITHGEIRRRDETNGRESERAHRDGRTAEKQNEGVSQAKFCLLASWLLTVAVVCDMVDHANKCKGCKSPPAH